MLSSCPGDSSRSALYSLISGCTGALLVSNECASNDQPGSQNWQVCPTFGGRFRGSADGSRARTGEFSEGGIGGERARQ